MVWRRSSRRQEALIRPNRRAIEEARASFASAATFLPELARNWLF